MPRRWQCLPTATTRPMPCKTRWHGCGSDANRSATLIHLRLSASFCIKAIRNACIDRIRSRAEANVPIDADFRHPASAEQADDEVSLQMSQSAIERAIAALPAPQQRVIRLSAYSCCTNDEIAAQTGFSDSNVRQLLSRARKTLRNLLLNKNAL